VKILFLDTYYENFLSELPRIFPDIGQCTYLEALNLTVDHGFGTASALSRAFRILGWQTKIIIPNSALLQSKWCEENLANFPSAALRKHTPYLNRLRILDSFLAKHGPSALVLQQILDFEPDVVYVQDINYFTPEFIRSIRRLGIKVIGEIASALPPDRFLMAYQAIVSALPPIVDHCRSLDIESFNLPLAFDDSNESPNPTALRDIDAIFIGSAGKAWQTLDLLKEVVKEIPSLRIYGPISDKVLINSGLKEFYFGEAWGRDMFNLLNRSKIALNRHGGIAGDYSVNMRMFEATGMGCLLLTDQKKFTSHLFEPDKEIIQYRDFKDAGILAKQYLEDLDSLQEISRAGNLRTLNHHTYMNRAVVLSEYLLKLPGK